jgi:uncharacterized membrane protein
MQERADLPTADSPTRGSDQERTSLIAVYLPMSYQVGGYTLYLDPARVSRLDVSREEALRGVLTGGSLTADTESGEKGAAGTDDTEPQLARLLRSAP